MTTSARSSYQEDSMPDIDVKPIVQEVTVPMAPGITEAHHGPMVAAHLIIRGVHRCGGRAETCAESCMVTIAVVLVDPDTGPGADRPPTIGWIKPSNVREIVAALLAAAATPSTDEVTR